MENNKENKQLLFSSLEEYQREVDRLKLLITGYLNDIEEYKVKLASHSTRNTPIIPIMGTPSHYRKTFPMLGSPEWIHEFQKQPIIFEMGEDCIEKRILSMMNNKSLGKTNKIALPSDFLLKPISETHTIEELLKKQSKGEKLTKDEKDRCTKYAEIIRKKRAKNKRSRR